MSKIHGAESWDRWVEAWNRHDLDAIVSLYAEDVVFTSTMVAELSDHPGGTIRGIAALRALFAAGLARLPNLRFVPIQTFAGVGRSALLYVGVREHQVIEVHELNPGGKIVAGWAFHGPSPNEASAPFDVLRRASGRHD